jgi:1-acyl-sn-glycerol-3-phosphate acyltransferase
MRLLNSMTQVDSVRHRQSSVALSIDSENPESSSQIHQNHQFFFHKASFLVQKRKPITASSSPSQFTPWMLSLAYPLGLHAVLPFYFGRIQVSGREHLPLSGPVILAPTHRSRWDSILVPFAAGHHVTGRHLRFMVTADEVVGLQGWFIRRMGGFPIDTTRPAISSLRYGVDLLHQGEVLVIFPEGNIFREQHVQRLKPGLARLALQAEASSPTQLGVKIVPIALHYSRPLVPWRTRVKINIGQPLQVSDYHLESPKQSAQWLTRDLQQTMEQLAIIT